MTDMEKSIANIVDAVSMQIDTISKLADSVRILNNRVERLEQERALGFAAEQLADGRSVQHG